MPLMNAWMRDRLSYAASSERKAVFVLFIRVQHAQLDRQLSVIISNNGERQRAPSIIVERHHVLCGTKKQA